MKSVKSLINTLSNSVKIIKENKKCMFIVSVIAIVCFIIFSLVVIHNVVESKRNYDTSIETINEETVRFNDVAKKYNELIDGLMQRNIYVTDRKIMTKEIVIPDYETFISNGSNYDSLSSLANSIRNEKDTMEARYNNNCKKVIENLCNNYNIEADKYNSMLDRLSSYENIVIPNEARQEEMLSAEKQSYTDNNTFFSCIDKIELDKDRIASNYYSLCLKTYNYSVQDYNIIAEEYNKAVKETSIDFIKDLIREAPIKKEYEDNEIDNLSEDELCHNIESIFNDTDRIIDDYFVVTQITNPSPSFVGERLKNVSGITGIEAVSEDHDPNGLLGKEGGYTSCFYFAFKDVDTSRIPGDGIIDKGTDAGGAVEIYKTLDEALNRCDYLSQFDGTLLYSGSYAVIGTMVVRTSYRLNDKQQIDLTNDITLKLTELL